MQGRVHMYEISPTNTCTSVVNMSKCIIFVVGIIEIFLPILVGFCILYCLIFASLQFLSTLYSFLLLKSRVAYQKYWWIKKTLAGW